MKNPLSQLKNILISRTDSIGDVVLTLPLAALLKRYQPQLKIAFLGKSYTRAVIEACAHVDAFADAADFLAGRVTTIQGEQIQAILHVFPVAAIARQAYRQQITWRIGTTNRLYHWTTCNRLVRLSRRGSDLHEAQLNVKLLAPFGIPTNSSIAELGTAIGLTRIAALPEEHLQLLLPGRYHLILHPKSQGSAREWGLDNFAGLIRLLEPERYQVFISGTTGEQDSLKPLLEAAGSRVTDITGKMDLATFMAFIAACDGLVANSTGPLHIAAAMGKTAIGIYPPMRPIHPGRWAPLGPKAQVMVVQRDCRDCRKQPSACHCIRELSPIAVKSRLDAAAASRSKDNPFNFA